MRGTPRGLCIVRSSFLWNRQTSVSNKCLSLQLLNMLKHYLYDTGKWTLPLAMVPKCYHLIFTFGAKSLLAQTLSETQNLSPKHPLPSLLVGLLLIQGGLPYLHQVQGNAMTIKDYVDLLQIWFMSFIEDETADLYDKIPDPTLDAR